MGAMASSQITSLTIVYSTIYSGADQRKHQSSGSLAFVLGINRWLVNSPHKYPVTRKCFHWLRHHDFPHRRAFVTEIQLSPGGLPHSASNAELVCCFVVSLYMLLNEQSNFRWFDTNLILVSPDNIICNLWALHYQPSVWQIYATTNQKVQPLTATAWASNHMPSKVWDEITYPFPNFNGATAEVWEWISNLIPQFIMEAITYPCWNWS